MGHPKVKIGIVLAQPPGYTETFMTSKIRGLVKGGFDVLVFSDKKGAGYIEGCRTVPGYKLPDLSMLRIVKTTLVLLFVAAQAPRRVWRFWKIERADGSSVASIIKSIFISAHILPVSLDRLHFGFTTLAVGRENLGKVLGVKMSTSFRGYDINIFPLKRPGVYKKLWSKLDIVHTISEGLISEARAWGMPPAMRYKKIKPAVDVRKFKPNNAVFDPEGVIQILTVARLQWVKGLEPALDAMWLLKKQGLKFRYTIVGAGVDYGRLRFACHQLGLENEVIFEGKKSHEEVADLMATHHVYIQPSWQEGFCNAAIEAQASGMICIVSNADGLKENVVDGVTGWVVPKGNSLALAEKVMEVCRLPVEQLEQVRNRARQRVEAEFTLSIQEKLFQSFFSDL